MFDGPGGDEAPGAHRQCRADMVECVECNVNAPVFIRFNCTYILQSPTGARWSEWSVWARVRARASLELVLVVFRSGPRWPTPIVHAEPRR